MGKELQRDFSLEVVSEMTGFIGGQYWIDWLTERDIPFTYYEISEGIYSITVGDGEV